MLFIVRSFEQLSGLELFKIYKLRNCVFVVEQNCPYQDPDDHDLKAHHVMLLEEKELAGYARILPPGLASKEAAIGRVVVDARFRGRGFGQLVMKHCLHLFLQLYKDQGLVISAQTYLLKFYNALGFREEGEEYLEDAIPHVKMRYPKPEGDHHVGS